MSSSDLDTLALLAWEDLQKDNVAAAEAKCLRALGVDREHEDSLSVLGMVLQAQGRHDDAIRVFNSLTLKHPASARHWENLGVACRAAKRYDAALVAFARMLALGPPSAVMLYNLGQVHAELLDLPSAHEVLSRAHSLAPRDAWISTALAKCSYDLGDFEGARSTLERWQEFEQLDPAALAEIAYLLTLMGQVPAAQAAIESLAALAPLGRAALTQANVLERLNRLHRGPRGAATGTIRREPAGLRPGSVARRGRACAARVEARTGPRFAQGGAQGSSTVHVAAQPAVSARRLPRRARLITTARLPR